MKNFDKYRPAVFLPPSNNFDWVKKQQILQTPIWCSVDLHDGNQALIEPMSINEKIEYFHMLVKIGFKEIGVSCPAANDAEYDFLRVLIEQDLIPDDVTIQVLTQAEPQMIEKTFEAVKGAKNAIIHLYNSTSPAIREQALQKSKKEIKNTTVNCADYIKKLSKKHNTKFIFQYSPEFFSSTEPEFSLEICNAVIDVWKPTKNNKVIINLPVTVENQMPHIYACQVEYMSKNIKNRENVIISVHSHNDRGCAVSDAEFGLLAGADRVEGTLFGNGERTGNVDIVTVALNLYSQGIDPLLDFSDIESVISTCERLTHMDIGPRTPYGGNLVFTAFNGAHQDVIAKGMQWWQEGKSGGKWQVPYLTIDPIDIGKKYENNIIRINSQSGKLGVCYILKQSFGFNIPEAMRGDFAQYVEEFCGKENKELSPKLLFSLFSEKYIGNTPVFTVPDYSFKTNNGIEAEIKIKLSDKICSLSANGNGRLDAISNAIKQYFNIDYDVFIYEEHALSETSFGKAVTYVGIRKADEVCWGVGVDEDIIKCSVDALIVAINQLEGIKQINFRDERMVALLNYIQSNYNTVTLDSLSNEFFLSKPYLSKYIKEHSGITFGDTVKSIRMDKAKTLLKNRGTTVESIARSVGYENVEHFNRLFKKLFNMTPVQYRNSK